jgi:hypothetical protein
MRHFKFVSSGVSAILLVIALEASGQKAAPSAEWAPSPAALKQLGVAESADRYSLRVPKGYEFQQAKNAPDGVSAWAWTGGARRDGTKPSITMMLITVPPTQREQTRKLSLEQLADKLLAGVKRQRTNWKQEKTETGVINGMKFARIFWEGTEPTRNWQMRGFIYVARDGNSIIQMASQDISTESPKSLTLAEAAVLTFKKP